MEVTSSQRMKRFSDEINGLKWNRVGDRKLDKPSGRGGRRALMMAGGYFSWVFSGIFLVNELGK
jgi:hypothetical protein